MKNGLIWTKPPIFIHFSKDDVKEVPDASERWGRAVSQDLLEGWATTDWVWMTAVQGTASLTPAYPIYHLSRPAARPVLHREQAKLARNGRAFDTRSLGQKSHLPGDTWSQMPSGAVLGQLLLKISYIQNGWRPHPEAQWLQQRWVQPSSRILTTSNQPNEVTLRVTESMEEPLSVLASHTKHLSKQRVTSSFSCICQIFEDIKQAKHV